MESAQRELVCDFILFMITYNNAKDADGNVVSIKDAVDGKRYYCLCCGNDMYPREGKRKKIERHFYHIGGSATRDSECNPETYLHKSAKHYIKKLFDDSSEFEIVLKQNKVCPHIESCIYYEKVLREFGDEQAASMCKKTAEGRFDLKRYYDTCEVEREYNVFRADVLLSSKAHPQRKPLFIEIVTSNKCKQEKLDSGIKIIEIFIPRDTDNLDGLKIIEGKQKLQSTQAPVEIKFHNFSREQVCEAPLDLHDVNVYYMDLCGEETLKLVKNKCSCFGRNNLIKESICEIHYPTDRKYFNKWCIPQNNKDFNGVRSCWLCKHHADGLREHFCSKGRNVEEPNCAYSCWNFQFDESKVDSIKAKAEKYFVAAI